LLACIFYSGPFVLYDDTVYISYAHDMLGGTFKITGDLFTFSILVISLLAFSFGVFGYSMFAAILPSIIEFSVLVVFVFLTGKELQGYKLAAIAALFAATSPIAVLYATRVLPDLLIGTLVAVAFYTLVKASKSASRKIFALSGFLIGILPLARTDGFMLIAFYMLALLAVPSMHKTKPGLPVRLYAFVGILIALAIYLAMFFAYTGNPLYAITIFSNWQSRLSTTLASNINVTLALLSPAWQKPQNPFLYSIGPVILFSVLGGALALRKRNGIAPLAVFSIGVFFYYLLGTSSLSSYSPIIVLSRYLASILMPMSITAAYVVTAIYESAKRVSRPYALLGAAALVIAATSLYAQAYAPNYSYNAGIRNETLLYEGILGYVNGTQKSNVTIYVIGDAPPLQAEYMNFLAGYSKRLQAVPAATDSLCTYSNDSLLAVITLGPELYVPVNLGDAYKWAGTDCGLELLRNATLGGHNALLFKIEKG
ncbi:MAG: glycosyltransferase family 39 protein, partial [Candidatus Micrarchaeaceae archaeon]